MDKVWDVIIVGGGPAALTAAIYTTRGNASTLILGGESWGGQLMLTTQVDNFPGFPDGVMGPDLMAKMKDQAVKFGAEFRSENATKFDLEDTIKIVETLKGSYQGKTVIIATGALTKWLEIKGEKELIGRGVSSCAPCDAPFFREKTVAVVGGGDSAMEEASYLAKFANKIYLIHRRDTFKASQVMQDRVKNNPKIEILWNTQVKEILGSEKVSGIKILNNKDNTEKEIALDGIFVAVGHKPNTDIFDFEKDEKGYIDSAKLHELRAKGVFIAGDVDDKIYKQAITASGFGCMAGMDSLNYLSTLNL